MIEETAGTPIIWDRLDIDTECMPRSVAAVLEDAFDALEREVAALTTQLAEKDKEMVRRLADLLCTVPTGAPFQSVLKRAEAAEAQRDELQKRIDTAVPLVAGGANTNQWIPVTQRFPPACHFLLVYAYRDGDPSHERCRVVREYYVSTHPAECVADDGITHWMPLPPAPDTSTASTTTLPTNGTEGLRAELNAAKRALAEKEGWMSVPVRPTMEMQEAGGEAYLRSGEMEGCSLTAMNMAEGIYGAMIAALAAKSTEQEIK